MHRIGRTGRAGREGLAVSLVSNDERPLLKGIERLLGQRIPLGSTKASTATRFRARATRRPRYLATRDARTMSKTRAAAGLADGGASQDAAGIAAATARVSRDGMVAPVRVRRTVSREREHAHAPGADGRPQ